MHASGGGSGEGLREAVAAKGCRSAHSFPRRRAGEQTHLPPARCIPAAQPGQLAPRARSGGAVFVSANSFRLPPQRRALGGRPPNPLSTPACGQQAAAPATAVGRLQNARGARAELLRQGSVSKFGARARRLLARPTRAARAPDGL